MSRQLLLYELLLLITSCASTNRIQHDAPRGLITIVASTNDVTFSESDYRRVPFEKGTVGNIAYVSKALTDAFEITCDVEDGMIPREQVDNLPPNQRVIISTWLARGVVFSSGRTSVSLRCIPTIIDESENCVSKLRDRASNWEVPWQKEQDLDTSRSQVLDSSMTMPFDQKELQKHTVYPKRMRDMGLTSRTVFSVLIDECGNIECYKRDSTQRTEFNEAARNAIFATHFRPTIEKGQPTRIWLHIPFNFRLR